MKEQFRLTTEGTTPYSRGGDIFMPEPGKGEIQPPETKAPNVDKLVKELKGFPEDVLRKASHELAEKQNLPTEEAQEAIEKRKAEIPEEARHLNPVVNRIDTERSILEGLSVSVELTEGERQAIIASSRPENLMETLAARRRQKEELAGYIDAFKRADAAGLFDPGEAHDRLNEAVRKGEINTIDAREYLEVIGGRAREILGERQRRPSREEVQEIENIKNTTALGSQERRDGLAAWIKKISPDIVTIDPEHLHLLAEDRETAEMFLDKIISKPFSAPEDQYRLSFYADINLSGYLTEVGAISEQMLEEFNLKKESSLRFHEMNRTIISESGNPDAFLGMSRSVSHKHLQTATQIDGVELFRQLVDLAYGRFYAKSDRLRQENFEPEIINWATERFYKEAGYVWNDAERKWIYSGGETVKSKFLDSSGNPKHMEEWEVKRAVAFGRNIHAAFYRHSELISWSSIPKEWEEWLKSMPSETVVRVMGGLKFLPQRFKLGETGGGPQFVWLLLDKIQAGYKKLIKDNKINIEKIGKLDIAKDLLPTGFLRAGGFDKGWRTLIAYLDNDATKVTIPDINSFPEDVRGGVEQFVQEYGNETSLYKFLIKQEYFAKMLTSMGMEIEGVEIPPEAQASNFPEQGKLIQKVLEPIMDQINLSLGVFINGGWANTSMKEALWKKAADFLPLRLGYILSEGGVKNLPGYGNVAGENGNLFNDEFESKLIRAQHLRIEAQKNSRTGVPLDNFFAQAGLSPSEIAFVSELRDFVKKPYDPKDTTKRSIASDLANISFPHVPFLDDVPFKNANYIDLGAEVFPRRIGGDFRAYAETNNALNGIVGDLGVPYKEGFLKHVKELFTSLGSPEGPRTTQDIILLIAKTRFEMAKQWGWTKIPSLKIIREFAGLPTSWLQNYFGPKADSLTRLEMNTDANEIVAIGAIRREQLPGEEKSQINDLLEFSKAKWFHVLMEQSPQVAMFFLLTMIWSFMGKLGERK